MRYIILIALYELLREKLIWLWYYLIKKGQG